MWGYDGIKAYGAPKLSPQETSFGVYCYAMCEMVPDVYSFNFNNKNAEHAYLQGQMQATIDLMETIAGTYIDESKMMVDYDPNAFMNKYKDSKLGNLSNLMPYVIHTVALQKGLDLENEGELMGKDSATLYSKLKSSKVLTIEELKSSVEQKFDDVNERL